MSVTHSPIHFRLPYDVCQPRRTSQVDLLERQQLCCRLALWSAARAPPWAQDLKVKQGSVYWTPPTASDARALPQLLSVAPEGVAPLIVLL